MNKIIISYKSTKQVLKETQIAMEDIVNGKEGKESHYEVSFTEKKVFTKFLKNIDILMAIKSNKPKSIYELAKGLGRDQSNINKIVLFFESYGIIKIKESIVNKRTLKRPFVEFDKIEFDLIA